MPLAHGDYHAYRGSPRRHPLTAARAGGGVLPMVLSDLVVNESTPSIDFTVTGGDGTAYIALSANAVETASAIRNWPTPATRFSFAVSLGGVSQSLDFSGVPDGTYYIHIVGENGAGLSNVLTYGPVSIAAAPVRSRTFCGRVSVGDQFSTLSGVLDIGASGSKFMLVGTEVSDNQSGDPTVVLGGVTLTKLYSDNTGVRFMAWYGGVVSGGGSQTLSITYSNAVYLDRNAEVWALRNLASNTPITAQFTSANDGFISFAVNAGDYLFAMRILDRVETLENGPTQSPDRQSTSSAVGFFRFWSGDWEIASTSSTFDMGLIIAGAPKTSYIRFA